MAKYRIAYVSSSRADYGIVCNYLRLLKEDKEIDLDIIVTGSLLEKEYDEQAKIITNDGFKIKKRIKLPMSSKSNKNIIKTMSVCLDSFGTFFDRNKYDLLILLGDRFEIMPVAIAAAIHRQKIIHIHGGEATFGNYDEFIRHSITKMSDYHFTSTNEYKNRIIQLGENPKNVYYLGSLGAENCLHINDKKVEKFIKELKSKTYFVVLFHPETMTSIDAKTQAKIVLESVDCFVNDFNFVFIGPNADTHSNIIKKDIKNYTKRKTNCLYIENINTDSYHYLLKNCICLIGNSSSGIIEAPSLGIYTINIGDRQKGRISGNSVINVRWNKAKIVDAIKYTCKNNLINPKNPYLKKGNIAKNYYLATKRIIKNKQYKNNSPKEFYDISIRD